jgi:hypothetical protein
MVLVLLEFRFPSFQEIYCMFLVVRDSPRILGSGEKASSSRCGKYFADGLDWRHNPFRTFPSPALSTAPTNTPTFSKVLCVYITCNKSPLQRCTAAGNACAGQLSLECIPEINGNSNAFQRMSKSLAINVILQLTEIRTTKDRYDAWQAHARIFPAVSSRS